MVHIHSGMLLIHEGNFWAVDTSGNYYAEVTQIYQNKYCMFSHPQTPDFNACEYEWGHK